jgi:hypothetical protein
MLSSYQCRYVSRAHRSATCARPPFTRPGPCSCSTGKKVHATSRHVHAALPAFSPAPRMSCGAFLRTLCRPPACVALAHSPDLNIYYCSHAFLLYTHALFPFTFVHPNVLLLYFLKSIPLIHILAYRLEIRGQYSVEEGRYCATGSVIVRWELAYLRILLAN